MGANGKTNVFYMLLRDCSEMAAAVAMARLARLTSYYLSKFMLNRSNFERMSITIID